MKEIVRMVIVLTLLCAVAAGLLAITNAKTEGPIEEVKRAELLNAIKEVLPNCDNEPDKNIYTVKESGKEWVFYVGRKDGKYVGAAIPSSSDNGYSGLIKVLIGVKADGTVGGLEILEQTETPGLGAKIEEPSFKKQFKGKTIEPLSSWAVTKDGGDIQQAVTGATISPRAVCEAVKAALEVYEKNKTAVEAQNTN